MYCLLQVQAINEKSSVISMRLNRSQCGSCSTMQVRHLTTTFQYSVCCGIAVCIIQNSHTGDRMKGGAVTQFYTNADKLSCANRQNSSEIIK